MAQLDIECKVTFTAWFHVAKVLRWVRLGYPNWMKAKTIAWIVCGNNVKQVKLSESS